MATAAPRWLAYITRFGLVCSYAVVRYSTSPSIPRVEQRLQIPFAALGLGFGNLGIHLLVVNRPLDVAEHADRLGKFRILHAAQQIRQARLLHLLVVKHQVVFADSLAELHDFQLHAVHPDALVAILAEDQRLAMLEFERMVGFGLAIGRPFEGAVVEHVAILIDLDERRAAMFGRSLKHGGQMLDIHVDRAGNECRLATDGQR